MKVQERVYRFRILNAWCPGRTTSSHMDPVTVVATDAGLMPVAGGNGAAAGRRALRDPD